MSTRARLSGSSGGTEAAGPAFIYHSSFDEPGAYALYGAVPENAGDDALGFMPDHLSRDCARRMHYAAWRARTAPTPREAARWRRRYLVHRDRIVLGNRKLTFRAVHRLHQAAQRDDLVGECQIVLIKAVARFNPWLGIRFSTYAFTCLIRALSRLSRRARADKLARSLPFDSLPSGYWQTVTDAEPSTPSLGHYFRDDHTLLTPREKRVLTRRFPLSSDAHTPESLAQLGRELGLSKERVRQVQVKALGKHGRSRESA